MAITASSLTSISGLLKQYYDKPEVIKNVMISAGPLLAELLENGNQEANGANIPCPTPSPAAAAASARRSRPSTPTAARLQTYNFLLTRGSTWGVGQVGQQVLEASANAPEGAFLADGILEVDAKRMRYHQYLAHLVYGWGDGVLFQLGHAATVSNTYIALDDPLLAAKVQTGDVLQYSSTAGGAPWRCWSLGLRGSVSRCLVPMRARSA